MTASDTLEEKPSSFSLPLIILLGVVLAFAAGAMAWHQGGLALGRSVTGFNPLYAGSGLAVGILVGLTGIGGGSLMTPLLVLLFGFHPATAVGTDLLYASGTKTVGTLVHGRNRTIDWRITARLAAGSIPATIVSVLILYALHVRGDAASHVISVVLGFALLLTAVTILFRKQLQRLASQRTKPHDPRKTLWLTIALGAALGVLITLSSVGAGAIGVTVLIFLYPEMPVSRIVGSDVAHAVPLTLIAGVGHLALGSVSFPVLGSLLAGSIPGIIIGSHLTARIPENVLRPILAGTLILVGGKLLF